MQNQCCADGAAPILRPRSQAATAGSGAHAAIPVGSLRVRLAVAAFTGLILGVVVAGTAAIAQEPVTKPPAASGQITTPATPAGPESGPVIGQRGALTCTVDRNVDAEGDPAALAMHCDFKPTLAKSGVQRYRGTINKLGVSDGSTAKLVLIWSVLSDRQEPTPGFLAVTFRGRAQTDDPSAGPAKSLVGGAADEIKLVPASEDAVSHLRPAALVTLQLDKVKL